MKWKEFLEYIKPIRHIRVGVESGLSEPFDKTFFKIIKKELINTVRISQSSVRFSVMIDDTKKPNGACTMFISRIRSAVAVQVIKKANEIR